jgi:TolA-binding protein
VKVSAQSRSSGSEDGWWKAEFGSPVPSRRKKEGRLIADSRFEAMPFYHEGLLHLKQGRPERAVESLKKFLEISPGHVYSDRAEYWIAQAYDQMGDTQMALTKLELLENRYPNSLRMPETLLNKAKLYEKLGKTVSARVTLRSLVGRYPNDPLSLEARKQLSLLTTKPRTPIPLMGH